MVAHRVVMSDGTRRGVLAETGGHVDGGDIRVVRLRRALVDGFHKFHDLGAVEEIAAGVAPLGTISDALKFHLPGSWRLSLHRLRFYASTAAFSLWPVNLTSSGTITVTTITPVTVTHRLKTARAVMFDYDFMRTAFAASGVVAVLSGVVGFFLVMRGQTFAGHALSHVGFTGTTGAVLVGISPRAVQRYLLKVIENMDLRPPRAAA